MCEKCRMPDDVQFDFVRVNLHMCIFTQTCCSLLSVSISATMKTNYNIFGLKVSHNVDKDLNYLY